MSTAVPEPVMLVGLMVAVRPGDEVTVIDTVPENPLTVAMVIVDVAEEPAASVILDGLAVMVKSGPGPAVTVIVTPVKWDNAPLVAVTIALYDPGCVDVVVEMVRMLVPVPPAARVTLVALRVATIPVFVTEDVRAIVPANELTLASVRVEVAEFPA